MSFYHTLNRLDDLIRERSILNHPFYSAWQKSELTQEQLAVYASVYYPHVAAFPGYLANAIDCTDDIAIRIELESNLSDELSNPRPHHELWLDFAEELGLDRAQVRTRVPHPAAKKTLGEFKHLTERNTGSALAALYSYESQQPEVAALKAEGLRHFYGINTARSLAYFDVHEDADIEHREGERRSLAICLENRQIAPGEIMDAARIALNAYWGLLDGVCDASGLPVS